MSEPRAWTLLAAVLGSSIVFLDSAVLTVALPAIGQSRASSWTSSKAQNYIQYGYLLTLSARCSSWPARCPTTTAGGGMFMIGLVGFGASSLLCGLAPNMELLIVARLVQGAAGALLVPGSLAILTNDIRGRGAGPSVRHLGGGVGPRAHPRAVHRRHPGRQLQLALDLPAQPALHVVAHLGGAASTCRRAATSTLDGHFDWLGALLVALAVGGLSFGAIYGQQRQWQDPLAFVALGRRLRHHHRPAVLLRRVRHPLVPLSMFRSRNFSVTNVSTLLIYGALYVTFFFLPLFLQGTLGYSASAVGLGSIPGSLFLIFLSTRFGTLAARYGPRVFMTVGPVIMAVGAAVDGANSVPTQPPGGSRSATHRRGCRRPGT